MAESFNDTKYADSIVKSSRLFHGTEYARELVKAKYCLCPAGKQVHCPDPLACWPLSYVLPSFDCAVEMESAYDRIDLGWLRTSLYHGLPSASSVLFL